MKYGFVKIASATPKVIVANPQANATEIIELIKQANKSLVELLVFPELCVSGYTCGEMFLSDVLKESVYKALDKICKYTTGKKTLVFVGSPIWKENKLYSCAVAFQNGKVLGVVPKTFLPSYSEFYELRHFTSGRDLSGMVSIYDKDVPFGTNILFSAKNNEDIKIAIEICEDLFAPCPPSGRHAQAGAIIIANLSASNELIGKSDYRRTLIKAQSGRLSCGYVYASAGSGESVNDMIFSGHRIIAENGDIITESDLFKEGLTISEIDTERLSYERRRLNVFEVNSGGYINVEFDFNETEKNLIRYIAPLSFVPNDEHSLFSRAELILKMQSQALAERLKFTGLNAVIGISGGLDSTLALLVTLRSYEILNKDKKDIRAITMPGPGTSKKTLRNVENLAKALNIYIRKISITETVNRHLKDINHIGKKDIAYENAQARERTQILMDIANAENGLVIGSGDLSEIALGWCTYNGDHMSMYTVNSSVPKTLVKHLVSYEAKRVEKYKKALTDILNTEISPELLPLTGGEIFQKTEDIIGPYELHDFFLYHMVRFGQKPQKTLFLATKAFNKTYSEEKIKKHFKTFLERFFFSQFKRNCFPDGVKIGTISLSPRGDWRMATESSAEEWLKNLKK
ncbi:MAG: NAD(+) synthase [Endomicrobium sp.]|jgi:NAD+ synthase (glutamine-hydrolysing)|nr:NAD(+) synthase [Endomicrobium sp.]MDR2399199.1 NAD(+) synthase [Endomicrobium sp.]